MCIHILHTVHTHCGHLVGIPSRVPDYVPPRYCHAVRCWFNWYHGQPKRVPVPDSVKIPKACPPFYGDIITEGNVWVKVVEGRCGNCMATGANGVEVMSDALTEEEQQMARIEETRMLMQSKTRCVKTRRNFVDGVPYAANSNKSEGLCTVGCAKANTQAVAPNGLGCSSGLTSQAGIPSSRYRPPFIITSPPVVGAFHSLTINIFKRSILKRKVHPPGTDPMDSAKEQRKKSQMDTAAPSVGQTAAKINSAALAGINILRRGEGYSYGEEPKARKFSRRLPSGDGRWGRWDYSVAAEGRWIPMWVDM